MKKNKIVTAVLIIAFCLPFVLGGCGGGGADYVDTNIYVEEPFSFEVPVNSHDVLRIQTISGSIEIDGSSTANSVMIEGERRVGSSSQADAEAHLDLLNVEVTDLGTEVSVKTIQPKYAGGRNYVVNYRITLPQNMEVHANHVNGPVFIEAIERPVSLNSISGEIVLVALVGSTQVNLVNGQIISEVTLPPNNNLELAIINGSIHSEVTMQSGGTIDLSVLNGSINLDIPQNTSASFEARAHNGAIRPSGLSIQNVVQTTHSFTGTLGSGIGDIRLETDIGNITVTGF